MNASTVSKTSVSLRGWALALACVAGAGMTQADISQEPLFLGGGGIPGNMLLVPSVEWPTIESVANITGTYTSGTEFAGYFDSSKCYLYVYSATESARYFKPKSISITGDRQCTGDGEWSGNFLNWATTQTIDPFRKILTGGLRVKDTTTETWLEKARHPGQGNGFPIRDLNNSTEVAGATPFSADRIRVRISGLGTEMRFSLNNYDYNTNTTDYQPTVHSPDSTDRGYEMSVRVSVCDPVVGVEDNCRQYGRSYKPEGLIQQNAESIRFSVFGYLNDSSVQRDGGVLRARQKYVGPRRLESGSGYVANDEREWDPDTGIFIQNPNPLDASNTDASIVNSGVINYLNKFGQLNSGNNKSIDPVSELYYAATRYLKNQGNVSAYSSMGTAGEATREQWRDGFPVITDWEDPIQYACQANVFLGIGDANTHRDKNLPGNTAYRNDEPTMPAEVGADTTIDVQTLTARVAALEGLGAIGETNSFSGRNNSAYIAGLAWDNHVRDIRSDLTGVQSASTHWVDVLENRVLEETAQNQYYLATKYGGFRIPEEFDPDTATGLEEAWWHSNGDILTPNGGNPDFPRPDNYYLAGEADAMIESLREAFSNIAEELQSSSAAVSANSTRLDTNTAVFQGSFNSQRWSGELAAFKILASGQVEETPVWTASEKIESMLPANRNIFTNGDFLPQTDGASRATTGATFLWDDLTATQKLALQAQPDATTTTVDIAKDRLNYLRGDRTYEQTQADQSQPFRRRDTLLGDIINSNPQFSHNANFGYGSLGNHSAYTGTASYAAFRTSIAGRPPMVLVGANDGMLHAFNAEPDSAGDGGKELFAFVPSGVYNNLYRLTLPDYAHRYFVDGTPRVADALLTTGWATLAVGTTGAGGRSVFALNVTDPNNFSAADVLWEFTHPDMGYTIQQPAVVALPSGRFGVVVSSGYKDTPQANSYIWILDVNDGSIIRTFEFENSGELGSPLVVDLNSNSVADRIYAGDTNGNLWRIDLDSTNEGFWDAPAELKSGGIIDPLFTDPDGRPITAQLTSAFNEEKEHMVFFGTGSFIRVGENIVAAPPLERFYGIIDRGQPITDLTTMLAQKIVLEGTFGGPGGRRFRVVSDENITASHTGWYMPLEWATADGGPNPSNLGERVVARALVRGDRVIFPTLIPDPDPCAFGGRSWLMEVEMENGGRLDYSVFDLDEDDEFNEDDFVNIGTVDDPIWVPTSGFDPDVGIINTPAVITGVDPTGSGNDDEVKVISGASGQLLSIPEAGTQSRGRQAWQQLR